MPQHKGCVLTIVREEHIFLPIWLRYYAAHFPPEDIHVLHHVCPGTEDRCCDVAHVHGANVIPVSNAIFDPVWLRDIVAEHQSRLLESYAAVLFAEVDEIVLPDLRVHAGLREYVTAFLAGSREAVRCVGWEMHHDFPAEPPADLLRPLLSQRRFGHRNELYSKALLTRRALRYALGFHTVEEDVEQDDALLLLHLHKYDFQAYLQRHEARALMAHSATAIEKGWNHHYRVTGAELLAQYMRVPHAIEPLPGWLREACVV